MSKTLGKPTEQQLDLINRLAPKKFTIDDVFVFGGKSAGDRIIENRYIQLSKELLETFAQNAKAGVSWLLNHSWASWSEKVTIYGRTFDARILDSSDKNETCELHIDKYMPRSDTLKDGRSTNSIIEDIENGILFDTSIGWGASKMVCSVCNCDYWSCNHWRGQTYEDGDGNQKLCYVIAKNPGYLMEESGVFDGAYEGAGISMAKDGDVIENKQGKFLVIDEIKEVPKDTSVYGIYTSKGQVLTFIKKPDNNKKTFQFSKIVELEKEGDESMDKIKEMFEKLGILFDEKDSLDKVMEKLSNHWQNLNKNNSEEKPEFLSKEKATEELGKEMTSDEILAAAKEGIQYHKDTVEKAVSLGVKVLGNDFPSETWKNTFSGMKTQAILDIAGTWEKQAKDKLNAGQKLSSDDDDDSTQKIPDEAYSVK